jgi:hypothetical protein
LYTARDYTYIEKTSPKQDSFVHASRPFLPVRRSAAAVEAGDDSKRFVSLDNEDQRVWKAAKQGAARVLVNYGELAWSGAYALNRCTNR